MLSYKSSMRQNKREMARANILDNRESSKPKTISTRFGSRNSGYDSLSDRAIPW